MANSADVATLFSEKAQQANAILGTIGMSLGNPNPLHILPDARRYQTFENGVIGEKVNNATRLADLEIIYTPFSSFIDKGNHKWLGNAIEDFYSAQNGAGKSIVVQRYENGVVWWDGQSEPCCLGWHDWHVIAWPGNNGKGVPNQGAFNTFWKDLEKLVLSFVRLALYVILGIVAFLVIIFACTR